MGRRSFDAQGNGSGLAPKQLGEAGEAFADRVRNQIDGDRIGVEALVADSENCIQPGGGRADHPLRPVVEAAPRSFVRELDRTEILLVARRAMPVRLQQAKRTLEARDPRRKLAARERSISSGLERKEVDHAGTVGQRWSRKC